MGSSCTLCRDTGFVIEWNGGTVPCLDTECLKLREAESAIQVLAEVPVEGDRKIFKGGAFKLSISIKGFELDDGTKIPRIKPSDP